MEGMIWFRFREQVKENEELLRMLRLSAVQQRGLPGRHLKKSLGVSFAVLVLATLLQPLNACAQRTFKHNRKPLPSQIQAMPSIDHELEVVRHRSQLMITRGKIVRTAIANPGVIEVVQYNPNELSIIGTGLGSTTMMLWFEDSPDPLIYLVRTIRDPDLEDQRRIDYGKLERKLAVLFPNSKVYLIPLSHKVIVKGQARDGEEAARILQIVRGEIIEEDGGLYGDDDGTGRGRNSGRGYGGGGNANNLVNGFNDDNDSSLIVNMLEVPGEHQIKLRVRIAQLSRAQLRQMGVNLNFLINGGRHVVGTALAGLPSTFTATLENGEIDVLVNWLASNGTAKILSEPTLTVVSGHSASFLSGGEFPVPTVVGIGGAQGQTTTFRGFGTSIIVTPTVIDKDLIRMRIVPEYSVINGSNGVGGTPGLDTQRVQTTVQLREGQTIALAGLISHQSDTQVSRIPFLGELPWIGPRLFAHKRATQDETELLILVTPELVRAMDPDEVPPVPGHYVTHPHDHELYHHGMTEGAPDVGYYQLAPLGYGSGHGIQVGYRQFNPAPASRIYSPTPNAPYGNGSIGVGGRAPAANPGRFNNAGGAAYGQQPLPAPAVSPQNNYAPSMAVPPRATPQLETPRTVPAPPSNLRSPMPAVPSTPGLPPAPSANRFGRQPFQSSQNSGNRIAPQRFQQSSTDGPLLQRRIPEIQPAGGMRKQASRPSIQERLQKLPRFGRLPNTTQR